MRAQLAPPAARRRRSRSRASGTAARIAGTRVEQHVDALPAPQRRRPCRRRRPSAAARAASAHAGDPLWTTASMPRVQLVRAREVALERADADDRRRRRREHPLDDVREHPPRLAHLAHEREAVRRVDDRPARAPAGEPRRARPPSPSARGRGRSPAARAASAHERPRVVAADARSRAGTAAARRRRPAARTPRARTRTGLVAVGAEPTHELRHVLRRPAVGRLADEGDPRHRGASLEETWTLVVASCARGARCPCPRSSRSRGRCRARAA